MMIYSNYTLHKGVYKSDSIIHDLNLNNIIFSLKKFDLVQRIFSENSLQCYEELKEDDELRAFSELRSDGVIEFKPKDETVYCALEYDRHPKSPQRYKKKLRDYYDAESIEGIFYICENKKIQSMLLKIDEAVCSEKKSKIYFCLAKEVLNHSGKVTLKNYQNYEIEIF